MCGKLYIGKKQTNTKYKLIHNITVYVVVGLIRYCFCLFIKISRLYLYTRALSFFRYFIQCTNWNASRFKLGMFIFSVCNMSLSSLWFHLNENRQGLIDSVIGWLIYL